MLVELGLVEQRYQAVLERLDGATVTEVARRYGVSRQTVHDWLRRYAAQGLAGLADRSSKPATCPHQMRPEIEARVVSLRREHPGWGQRSIRSQLRREQVEPLPSLSAIYRALVRHGLVDPQRRRRRRSDYKRWERTRAMELWQMDVMGRVRLTDGTELSVVTGIDDHSRFCVCARLVHRATAKPVCDALTEAMRRHGVPDQILTDNGKVFTGRFGLAKGPVLFDRICVENGVRHLLTTPYSPTTTGKIERLHKTMRAEFFNANVFTTIEETQAALDIWVEQYNTVRPHQGIGDVPPLERFQLARRDLEAVEVDDEPARTGAAVVAVAGLGAVTRQVGLNGRISLGGFAYHVGRWLAGETVSIIVREQLVEISHRGVLVATHAQRRPAHEVMTRAKQRSGRPPRPASVGHPVTRLVDSSGSVSFAGAMYRVGNRYKRRQAQVAIVAGSVQIAIDGKVIRVHPIKHDRAKEHGAFANPTGRPERKNRSVA